MAALFPQLQLPSALGFPGSLTLFCISPSLALFIALKPLRLKLKLNFLFLGWGEGVEFFILDICFLRVEGEFHCFTKNNKNIDFYN